MRRRQTIADVSCGVPRSRRLKKKRSRAVQSSRHFTPYFLRDCVVRAIKRPLPEDRHKLESRGIRKSHSRVGNRSVCERKFCSDFSFRGSLFFFFFFVLRNALKCFDIDEDLSAYSLSYRNRFHVSTGLVTTLLLSYGIRDGSRKTRGFRGSLSASIAFSRCNAYSLFRSREH